MLFSRHRSHAKRLAALLLMGAALAGCQLLYAATGKGKQEALFKFGKEQRVLVLVDVREGVAPPPSFSSSLADKVSTHLFHYKATDHVVPQERLVDLQQSDPAKFRAMGIADVAQAAGADVVVRVYLTQLDIPTSADGNVAEGDAEAFVKVVDRKGTRLYPGDATGVRIVAHVDPGFVSERDAAEIQKKLLEMLAVRAGRMFHEYDMEDKEMIDGVEDRKVIGR